MKWHVAAGLTAIIVETPLQLRNPQRSGPPTEIICKQQGVPTAGNAMGNTQESSGLDWCKHSGTAESPKGK